MSIAPLEKATLELLTAITQCSAEDSSNKLLIYWRFLTKVRMCQHILEKLPISNLMKIHPAVFELLHAERIRHGRANRCEFYERYSIYVVSLDSFVEKKKSKNSFIQNYIRFTVHCFCKIHRNVESKSKYLKWCHKVLTCNITNL